MLDRKEFEQLRKDLECANKNRESIIRLSRDITSLSKRTIYNLHRNEIETVERLIKEMDKKFQQIKAIANEKTNPGSLKTAIIEYVEAMSYYYFIKERRLIKRSELGVNAELFLLGLCDLAGELFRKAVLSAIDGKTKIVKDIHAFLNELHGEMLFFDFVNGELRKRFDSIKYAIKNIDKLMLELKLKGLL